MNLTLLTNYDILSLQINVMIVHEIVFQEPSKAEKARIPHCLGSAKRRSAQSRIRLSSGLRKRRSKVGLCRRAARSAKISYCYLARIAAAVRVKRYFTHNSGFSCDSPQAEGS